MERRAGAGKRKEWRTSHFRGGRAKGGKMSKEFVIVTGASSGIGAGLARALAERGDSLILVGRRLDRLAELQKECASEAVEIHPVELDLGEERAAEWFFAYCEEKGWRIKGLVNNAGLGFQGEFCRQDLGRIDNMIQVNLVALTRLCRLFLPKLLDCENSYLMNIASTAAMQPVPYFAVYAATKVYVLSLSEALHEEYRKRGVLVTCVCPGPVNTEFQKVAGMSPRFFARSQTVEDVVRACLKAVEKRKAVVWTSGFQRIFSLISESSPRFIRRRVARRMMLASMD